MKSVFLWAMAAAGGLLLSGCSTAPHAGGLATDDWYTCAKLLSNGEMRSIDLILERSEAVHTDDSWNAGVGGEHDMKRDTRYSTLIYRSVRHGLYVPKCAVLWSRRFAKSMIIDDGIRYTPEDERLRIDRMPPTFILYSLSPVDSELLRQILSPWRSEDEERDADGNVERLAK